MDKKIAKIVVGLPLDVPFDYLVPQRIMSDIEIGCRVWVQFGFRKMVGYVVGFSQKSKYKKVRPIISLIDRQPILSKTMLRLTKDFAGYYFCSWAEAIETSLSEGIRKGKVISPIKEKKGIPRTKNKFSGILIHDFYKERYWEILCQQIKDRLKEGSSVLFLVPEKTYLRERLDSLNKIFPVRISVLERRQGIKGQTEEWRKIRNGEVDIVLGTRSAVFAPLPNLGMIIVEDEDNFAYKQEQGPFYHAREVAIMRSRQERLQLILTSSIPSLEAIYLTKLKGFKLIQPESSSILPRAQLVDLAQYRRRKDGANIISIPLQENLLETMNKGERAILFINRKGFSTFLRCKRCGFSLKCPRCNVSLTYHYDKNKLICRFCHYKLERMELCPQCNSDYIRFLGAGTEKVESEIHRLFPNKRILRLDSDKKIKPGDFDVLISTQMLLKEPLSVTADLVAVLQVDSSLNRLDFRAAEKTFSVLLRLLRLARQKFIIQTHNREHYSIKAAATADFIQFYEQELKLRRGLGFPPFKHFVSVMLRGKSEEKVRSVATWLAERLNKLKLKSVEIFEPQPDMPAKLRGNFRWCILLKGKNIKDIHKLLRTGLAEKKGKSGIIISVNVDV